MAKGQRTEHHPNRKVSRQAVTEAVSAWDKEKAGGMSEEEVVNAIKNAKSMGPLTKGIYTYYV